MYFSDWETKEKYKDAKISQSLLWDFDPNNIDFHKMRSTIVQRVIERGRECDFYAAIKLYGGLESFRDIIKNEVPFLSDMNMDFVCFIFNLKKEELKCYIRKQLRKELLNS